MQAEVVAAMRGAELRYVATPVVVRDYVLCVRLAPCFARVSNQKLKWKPHKQCLMIISGERAMVICL